MLAEVFHATPPPNPNLSATLKSLWRKMDATTLLWFMVSKQKESASLRTEIATTLEEAMDPAQLVVEAVEEFLKSNVVEIL